MRRVMRDALPRLNYSSKTAVLPEQSGSFFCGFTYPFYAEKSVRKCINSVQMYIK